MDNKRASIFFNVTVVRCESVMATSREQNHKKEEKEIVNRGIFLGKIKQEKRKRGRLMPSASLVGLVSNNAPFFKTPI